MTINHESELKKFCEDCKKILNDERAAVEAYDLAIKKFDHDPRLSAVILCLQKIRSDHDNAVRELTKILMINGETLEAGHGLWGNAEKLLQCTANLWGEDSAVEILKVGEQRCLDDYWKSLGRESLSESCRDLFAVQLIPRIESHLQSLSHISEIVD